MGKAALIDYDIVIRGGGPLACAIARDAAGRGLSVFLVSEHDLGGDVAQHIISFGLTQIQNTVAPADYIELTRNYPQVELAVGERPETPSALAWLFKKKPEPQEIVFCGATINRFALLNMRDAVERGARFVVGSDISYTSQDSAFWQVDVSSKSDDKLESVTARIVIDTLPISNKALSARTALFDRPDGFTALSKTDGVNSHFAFQSGTESVVIGLIAETEPSAQDMLQFAQAQGINDAPIWMSAPFAPATEPAQFALTGTPPLFTISDTLAAGWRKVAEDVVAEVAPYTKRNNF